MELIKTFEKVQKIPYKICKYNRKGIDKNLLFGDCRHKTEFLYKLIKIMGYNVKKVKVLFDWHDLPIPKKILSILKNSTTIWPHDSLKVKINNKWIKVDCTWNLKLEDKKFPVTKKWDGENDTEQVTRGKLQFIDKDEYDKKKKINPKVAKKFAKALNEYLSQ